MKIFKSLAILIALKLLPSEARIQCNDDYALLSISYSIDKNEWDALYTQNPPKLKFHPSINADLEYTSYEEVEDFEMCIPKSGQCLEITIEVFSRYSYQISWNGKVVETGVELSYLGYPISTTQVRESCVPYCNGNESLVELFMDRQEFTNCSTYPYFSLQLDTVGPENYSLPLHFEEDIPSCNNRLLVHEKICVPKGSCGLFQILSDRLHSAKTAYSLLMDGVHYRSKSWYLSRDQGQTIYLGNCTASNVCNTDTDALFELDIQTSSEPELFPESFGFPSSEFPWFLDPHVLSWNDYIESYSFDSSYKTMECVPKEQCQLNFGMKSTPFFANYTIKRNGEPQSSRDIRGRQDWDETNYTFTTFGIDCLSSHDVPDSLSVGAVVGIIFASLLVFHIIFGYLWYKKRSASRINPTDKDAAKSYENGSLKNGNVSIGNNKESEYGVPSFESYLGLNSTQEGVGSKDTDAIRPNSSISSLTSPPEYYSGHDTNWGDSPSDFYRLRATLGAKSDDDTVQAQTMPQEIPLFLGSSDSDANSDDNSDATKVFPPTLFCGLNPCP